MPSKLCVPHLRGACEESFCPGTGLLIRIRVHAGPTFLQSSDHMASGDGWTVTFSGMKSASSRLPFGGSFSSVQEFKDNIIYIPWGGTRTLPPRLYYCFLTASPFSLHPLPSLISNYLNLPFETQRKWRREAFVPKSSIGSCLISIPTFLWYFSILRRTGIGQEGE